MTAVDNGPGAQLGNLVANVGGRIQEILDTAERVAGEIRTDAEAAGATYLLDRQREADRVVQERMAELDAITQLLTARAASMERETSAFVAEVEQVRWRMARLIGDDGPPDEPATGDASASRTAPQSPEATGRGISQAAALCATQMAVAGAERSEIEHMLRDQFGIDDPLTIDGLMHTGGA
ncbi:MAG: hypothetical protein WKF62_00565 [Solirubrobacterales bacterium]